MQLPNQGPGMLDKLSQNTQTQMAIPEFSANMHWIKEAAEAQILGQPELKTMQIALLNNTTIYE